MIKRTIEISERPLHLRLRSDQLLLVDVEGGEVVATAPCEDVGVLIVDQVRTGFTQPILTRLAAAGAVVVLCGDDHLPCAMVLPLSTHSTVATRIRAQVAAKLPLRKRLWQQLVRAKIAAQADNLHGDAARGLHAMTRAVRSGDPTNVEAQAARRYWSAWALAADFRRDPAGTPPNNLLNYGYAIMRAAVARALVGAGLHPAIGLHHQHRANAFCLADDLVEPLRPLVDERVRTLWRDGELAVTRRAKQELLELLTLRVATGGERGPLLVHLHRYVASLVACLEGHGSKLDIPRVVERACDSADID